METAKNSLANVVRDRFLDLFRMASQLRIEEVLNELGVENANEVFPTERRKLRKDVRQQNAA